MLNFRIGTIVSLSYSRWKHNRKIYAFILYSGPGSTKVHALNVGSRTLSYANKAKIANVIARLSKIPAASQWDGATLYRIFKTYLPKEVAVCYRTYFHTYITHAAIINYGFNDPDSFDEWELSQSNKALMKAAGKDLYIKLLNTYTGRGVQMKKVEDSMAQASTPVDQKETPANTVEDSKKTIDNKTTKPEIEGYY